MSDPWSWADAPLKARLQADAPAVLKERGVTVPVDTPPAIVAEALRIVSLLWVEGQLTPLEGFRIDPSDEGLLFGRGVWESTRTVKGEPWLWESHADRMLQSAKMLAIDLAPERLPSRRQITDYARALTQQDVVIRVNASAGRPGGKGLVWMSAALLPVPSRPMRLKTTPNPIDKGQAYLTLKTFQYATRLRIGQMAGQAGFDSALLVDDAGNLQEASHANIFLRFPEGWLTPAADGGFLPGTVRHYLLHNSPLPIAEAVVPASRLGEASEIFVTNSNVGIVPVTAVDDHTYPVGQDTQGLINWLRPQVFVGNQLFLSTTTVIPR